MTDPVTGMALSLALFLFDKLEGKAFSRKLVKEFESDRTIRDHIEWLRRQNHAELISRITEHQVLLMEAIGENRDTFGSLVANLSDQISRQEQTITQLIAELNKTFQIPVLSSIPIQTRPLAPVPLTGRDTDLSWIQAQTKDMIIYGQPGSGKTYLIYHYARQCNGRFVLPGNPDAVISALQMNRPQLLIVDDAAGQEILIRRLFHARQEYGLPFQLIVTCWPFHLNDVQAVMQPMHPAVHELPLLGRRFIAEIIKTVITDAGYQPENAIVTALMDQAAGRPGLAVSLTDAALHGDFHDVIRGEHLARMIGQQFEKIAGSRATQIMAAFSIGGKHGMEMEAVSKIMEISIFDLHEMLTNMAPGGVLEALSKSRYATIPPDMGQALIKDVFCSPHRDRPSLPFSVFEALYDAAPDTDQALINLTRSMHAGSDVPTDWLLSKLSSSDSSKAWETFAYLGQKYCQTVLNTYPNAVQWIVDPALSFIPSEIIPWLLDKAVGDARPLNAYPEAPLRKLSDWVTTSRLGSSDPVAKRRALFKAIQTWVVGGGDRKIAAQAFELCFSLSIEMTEHDPCDEMKITYFSALIPMDKIESFAAMWFDLTDMLRKHGITDWKPIVSIVDEWLYPRRRFGQSDDDDYKQITRPVAKRMIKDLIDICDGHNGFLRWAYLKAEQAGINRSDIPVNQEYFCLFPDNNIYQDLTNQQQIQSDNVTDLAKQWVTLPIMLAAA